MVFCIGIFKSIIYFKAKFKNGNTRDLNITLWYQGETLKRHVTLSFDSCLKFVQRTIEESIILIRLDY